MPPRSLRTAPWLLLLAASPAFAAAPDATPGGSHAAELINVRDYGAKGDCATDDSAAINAALARASPTVAVYFPRPPGACYAILSPVLLPDARPSTIYGDGKGVSTIRALGAMPAVVLKGKAYVYNSSIHDLTIDGNALAGYAIDLQVGRGFNIHDAEIVNPTIANIRVGDGTHQTFENKINHNSMVNSTDLYAPRTAVPLPSYNILLSVHATDNMIEQNDLANATIANFYDQSQGGNNFVIGNHAYGFPIPAAYAQYCFWGTGGDQFIGNEVDGCSVAGFRLDGHNNKVTNSIFQWPQKSAGAAVGVQIASGAENDLVTNNTFLPGTIAPLAAVVQKGTAGANTVVRFNPGALYVSDPLLTQAQGNGSTAATGTARGANAVDWQQSRATPGAVASGPASVIAGGANNEAAAANAIVAGGASNKIGAAATNSVTLGSNNATNTPNALVSGWNGTGSHVNEFTRSFGQFAAPGDRQEMTEGLYATATGASPQQLTADGHERGPGNTFGLANFQAANITIRAVCRNAKSGDKASWYLGSALLGRENGAPTTQLVGKPGAWDKAFATPGAAAWTMTYAADTVTGGVDLTFTGQAGTKIDCFATVTGVAIQ